MAGRLENQMWCAGLEVQQQAAAAAASDRVHHHQQQQRQELDEPSIKCSSDTGGALYPVRNSSNSSTASGSIYYSSSSSSSGGGGCSSSSKYLQSVEYAPRLVGTYPPAGQSQWASMDGTESPQHRGGDYAPHHQFSMSGGPPQHPHGRQAPPNSAWNHLQVPNFYPARQPQHAHMSSELPLLATPTWHTPTTTEPSKAALSHSPLFNLQQMLGSERPYARHSPGVDLTLTRNGSSSQNGDLPQTPISLSVRDTKQINSLPVGAALDGDRAVELTKGPSPDCQPSPKNMRRPAAKRMDSIIDRLSTTSEKHQQQQQQQHHQHQQQQQQLLPAAVHSVIVTAAASSSHDENSNSSQGTAIASAPTPTPMLVRDDDVASPVSNEDSLDSNKSRRKRKPSKTMKVAAKEDDLLITPPVDLEKLPPAAPLALPVAESVPPPVVASVAPPAPAEVKPSPARRRSSSEPPVSPTSASKSRRKTVSESETIDNIAAMVAATKAEPVVAQPLVVPSPVVPLLPAVQPVLLEPVQPEPAAVPSPAVVSAGAEQLTCAVTMTSVEQPVASPVAAATPVSVITRDHSNCSSDTALNQAAALTVPVQELPLQCNTAAPSDSEPATEAGEPPQKADETECFVAVEDELEKMFAGIADSELSAQSSANHPLAVASTSQSLVLDNVTSTSNDVAGTSGAKSNSAHKRGRPKGSKNSSRRASESNSTDSTPRKKHKASKKYEDLDEVSAKLRLQSTTSKKKSKKAAAAAAAAVGKLQLNNKPDVVKDVYSYDSGSNASSSRSKGPFIQIKGPRDSPISVSIVNTPCHEDDPDKPAKQLKNKKFHDDSEYRHKVRSKGLHCSTLSNKYDAQTRDASWICVFCKRGPHATDPDLPGPSQFTLDTPQYSPGDLFGPYMISTECGEYQRRTEDPFDAQFKSKKSAQTSTAVLQQQCTMSPSAALGKKSKKRQNSESSLRDSVDSVEVNARDLMFGIAEVTPTSYEVWAHEDCVIWGPGVYLVGPKIIGLEGAVWGACAVPCRRCGLRGAAVCCLRRGCGRVMHIGCARLAHWQLDEQNYKAYCTEHTSRLHSALP